MNISFAGDLCFSSLRGISHNYMISEKYYSFKQIFFAHFINKINKKYKLYELFPFIDIKLNEYSGFNWESEYKNYLIDSDPFEYIKLFFQSSNISFLNLESPFSKNGRPIGDFNSDPDLLVNIKNSGFNIVSIANNHAFDQGESGFENTLKNLSDLGIEYVGGGYNINDARRKRILTVNEIKIGFLAYSNFCNHNFYSLVRNNSSGILPLYYKIIQEDIEKLKNDVDYIFVYLHFGLENLVKIHNQEILTAHKIIDFGADIVLGGHSHIPKGIEIYKNKPIIYSLGNFIFPFTMPQWGNNMIASIDLTKDYLQKLQLFPILSTKEHIIKPNFLSKEESYHLLRQIIKYSDTKLNTKLHITSNGTLEYIFNRI